MADLKQSPISSPQPPSVAPIQTPKEKHTPGQSWKENEEHVLPHNRLGIVFFGLMSCTFLAALDQVRIVHFVSGVPPSKPYTPADDRRHSTPHHRGQTWWWEGLQLGRKVETRAFLPDTAHLIPCISVAPICSRPLPSAQFMARRQTSLVRGGYCCMRPRPLILLHRT